MLLHVLLEFLKNRTEIARQICLFSACLRSWNLCLSLRSVVVVDDVSATSASSGLVTLLFVAIKTCRKNTVQLQCLVTATLRVTLHSTSAPIQVNGGSSPPILSPLSDYAPYDDSDSPAGTSADSDSSCENAMEVCNSSGVSTDTSTDHKSDNDDYEDDEVEDEELDSDDDHDDASDQVMKLNFFVCVFLSFFQLCFRLSDKAFSFLLKFMSVLIKHLCSLA